MFNDRSAINGVHRIARNAWTNLYEHNQTSEDEFSWQGEITGIVDAATADSVELDRFLCPEDDLAEEKGMQFIVATQTTTVFDLSIMESNDSCRDIAVIHWDEKPNGLRPTNYLAISRVTGSAWKDDKQAARWRGAMIF